MPSYYLDTSALVKYYIREPGTEFMVDLLENTRVDDEFFTSFLIVLEFSSAVFRRNGSGGFTRGTASQILNRFDDDAGTKFRFWPLTHEVIANALEIVDRFRLRAGDTIHLTSALNVASENGISDHTYMISSDRELIAAVRSTELIALDPQAPDSVNRLKRLRASGQ